MSTWNFKGEDGSGLAAGTASNAKKVGNAPMAQADNLASKRNVILTGKGWVRRVNKQDSAGNRRVLEEVLVAANPGENANTGYASNTHAGSPDVQQMYLTTSANVEHTALLSNGNISITGGAAAVHVHVVFNEPIVPTSNASTIVATAVNGGSNETFTSVPSEGTHGANNIVVFKSSGTVAVGSYQVKAQTIGGNKPFENVEAAGTDQATDRRFANLVSSGAATTTLAAGAGTTGNTFTIAS